MDSEPTRSTETLDRFGSPLFRRCWAPCTEPKAIVHILHGLAEHSGRVGYDQLAMVLAKEGFVVYANDHRCHGETNTAQESQLGYHEGGVQLMIDDAVWMIAGERLEHSNKKLILLGQGMGSVIASHVAKITAVDGLIMIGAPNPHGIFTKCCSVLLKTIKMTYGDKHFSKVPQKLVYDDLDKKFVLPEGKNRWITSDEEALKLYNEDPMCGFRVSVRIYNDIYRFMQKSFISSKHWRGWANKTSTWLLAGEEDRYAGTVGASCKSIAKLIQRAGGGVQVSIYQNGARHDILNEYAGAREALQQDILAWATKIVALPVLERGNTEEIEGAELTADKESDGAESDPEGIENETAEMEKEAEEILAQENEEQQQRHENAEDNDIYAPMEAGDINELSDDVAAAA